MVWLLQRKLDRPDYTQILRAPVVTAKFSRSLVRRLYDYALERGWVKPGDTVLDPFGGVGLGALDAMANGLNWVGCELENRFALIGNGCDCVGVSPARFQFPADTPAPTDIHRCPDCLTELARLVKDGLPPAGQMSLFDRAEDSRLAPGWRLDENGTPYSLPHHYTGNLELFSRYAQPGTWSVLLQGDSRYLSQRLAEAGMIASSPPYLDWKLGSTPVENPNAEKYSHRKGQPGNDGLKNYGQTPGNLGNLPAGNLDSILSSPSFAGNTGGRGEASRNGIDAALFDRHSGGMKKGTGDDPANLDHLPMKDFDLVVGSSPFAGSIGSDTPEKRGGLLASDPKRAGDRNLTGSYGQTEGQLGAMKAGAFEADGLVGSPPFEKQTACDDPKYHKNRTTSGGPLYGDYGRSNGQLGIEQGTTFWAAARQILTECHLVLKPGAYCFWVCKPFIRDRKRVEFPHQWRLLCESVGFEYVESIYAMQVGEPKYQMTLEGGSEKIQKAFKSFFRRLIESRLTEDQGHLRIDWEEVIVMRKPLE